MGRGRGEADAERTSAARAARPASLLSALSRGTAVAAVTVTLAALGSGCRAPLPPPPEAHVDVRVRAFHGSPISGPVPLEGALEPASGAWLGVVHLYALALPRGDLGEAAASRAAVAIRADGLRPEVAVGPLASARFAAPVEREAFARELYGETGVDAALVGRYVVALPPGATVAIDAEALRAEPRAPAARHSVHLHAPRAAVPARAVQPQPPSSPASGAAAATPAAAAAAARVIEVALVREVDAAPGTGSGAARERILFDPLPLLERGEASAAVIFPLPPGAGPDAPHEHEARRPAAALAAVIEVRPAPASGQSDFLGHAASWRAVAEDARRQAAPPAPARAPAPRAGVGAETRAAGDRLAIDDALRGLREPIEPRRALASLGRRLGGEWLVSLALAAPDPLVREVTGAVASAGFGDTRRVSPAELRLFVERAAVEGLAEALIGVEVPPEIDAIVCRHAGALSRKPSDLVEIVRAATSYAAIEEGLVDANRRLLRDASALVRARALAWLAERGDAPPGFDALAPADARRAALATWEAARAERERREAIEEEKARAVRRRRIS